MPFADLDNFQQRHFTNIFFFSMEQLDDDQIEQLMLESDGYDTLQDAKSPVKLAKKAT